MQEDVEDIYDGALYESLFEKGILSSRTTFRLFWILMAFQYLNPIKCPFGLCILLSMSYHTTSEWQTTWFLRYCGWVKKASNVEFSQAIYPPPKVGRGNFVCKGILLVCVIFQHAIVCNTRVYTVAGSVYRLDKLYEHMSMERGKVCTKTATLRGLKQWWKILSCLQCREPGISNKESSDPLSMAWKVPHTSPHLSTLTK